MAIMIHTSRTTTQQRLVRGCGYAFIYLGGQLVVQTRAATDAEAVKEAVRQFRMTRSDRRASR